MTTDFTGAPPSRRMRRPEHAELSDADARVAERRALWGDPVPEQKPLQWQPGAPSHPGVLRLLEFPHAANGQPLPVGRFQEPPPPGPHATDADLAAYAGRRHRAYLAWQEADDNHMQRFRFWVGLDVAQKTQLAADCQFPAAAGETPFLCTCVADPAVPPVVLHAPNGHEARVRYMRLTGIRNFTPARGMDDQQPIQVAPYVVADPAPAAPPATQGE
jgi:hypothetical protein